MIKKIYKHYYIYKTTNLINGKYYFGMHCTDNLNDGYIGSGTQLKRSIIKHGKENFKTEILEFLPTKEELIKREKEIINEEILNDPNSMNLQPGGGGGLTTDEHKRNFFRAGGLATLHLLKKYRENHFNKMKSDIEYRKKYIDKIKGNRSWLGKNHKEETKNKIGVANSIKQKGDLNSQFGTCWITNGTENKKVKKEDTIPEGWKLGRTLPKKIF
jgi:hypothetical protein